MRLAIVVPVLDEADQVSSRLQALAPYRTGGVHVVVVDGGSGDDTVQRAAPLADQVLVAPRGRASQMNAGARAAAALGADALLFPACRHALARRRRSADRPRHWRRAPNGVASMFASKAGTPCCPWWPR
jgi:glycosyltransferase involved in cell wall biosynthesis